MRQRWIVWYAIVLHIVWAVLLLLQSGSENCTAIYGMLQLIPNRLYLSILLFVVGSLAIVGVSTPQRNIYTLLCVLPQKIILFFFYVWSTKCYCK